MSKKSFLKVLKSMFETKYYGVPLSIISVEQNLLYFDGVLNSINYENMIPRLESEIEDNLSLIPKTTQGRTIYVYQDGEDFREMITNKTITYKRREGASTKTHLGESGILFIEIEGQMKPASDEELEVYEKIMSGTIKAYLATLTAQTQNYYTEIMTKLQTKLLKKRAGIRR